MNIASLLLALITVATGPDAYGSSEPVLLDFHAEWCGPCKTMRPVVKQFIRNGHPVKSVDIDRAADFAKRYDVTAVPTFIVIDDSGRELARTSGYQPLADLERFYRTATAEARPPQNANAHTGSTEDDSTDDSRVEARATESGDDPPASHASHAIEAADRTEDEANASSESSPVNPKPWESVVRIRVLARNSVGFGSGTIISSTPQESWILTCAHIFKLEGRAKPVPPKQFPREIKIDLFDGKLRGQRPAQVHFLETVDGEAIDYDFVHDVGLIRIRPGRRLPASRVAPAYWEPKRTMRMLTVGCSEGQDATAWHTVIKNPRMSGSLIGSPAYEAIECDVAPKQGRSGGGLFTDNGYIAGVCNFAEPRGDHGLYATPRSIYRLLDRNQLANLYAPIPRDGGTLLADAPARNRPQPSIRGQSPESEGAEQIARQSTGDRLMMPDPSDLGIPEPVARTAERKSRGGTSSRAARKVAWTPKPDEPVRSELETDLSLDPAADHDHFGATGQPRAEQEVAANAEDVGMKPEPQAAGNSGTKRRWHAVPSATATKSSDMKLAD